MIDNAVPEQCVRFQASATSQHGCPITVDQMWAWFCAGYSYTFSNYFIFAAAAIHRIVFDATACACDKIMFNTIGFSASAGPVLVDFYANPTSTSTGTVLTPIGRIKDQTASDAVIRYDPTISDIGTKLPLSNLVPSAGVAAPNRSGASSSMGIPFEIDHAVPYGIVLENLNGADTYVKIDVTWFELPTGF